MAVNLLRNANVFFTTAVNATTGVIDVSAITTSNTQQIQVLDGFSFSQATTTENITLNEAGATPNRGQRGFITAQEAAEFSMSTYVRPKNGTTNVEAEESVLWNAFCSADAIGTATSGWDAGVLATGSKVVMTGSNKHQLQKFGLIVVLDTVTYLLNNCVLNTATIDFGLDQLATIAWTGNAATILRDEDATLSGLGTATVTITGLHTSAVTVAGKVTDAQYIANKLSVVTLTAGIGGTGTSYTVPITGGSITMSNNVTYLTPQNLGIINQPVTYFTGVRDINGNITAYLRSGETNDTSDLIATLLGNTSDVSPAYQISVKIGGNTGPRVEMLMPAAMIAVPTINVEQVVGTTINFVAQSKASGSNTYDITQANEIELTYRIN
jgi:hypothetical protein